jgi:hypothetical protein
MNAAAKTNPTRVLILRMVAGAVVGAATTGLFLAFVGDPFLDLGDPTNLLAIVAGLTYVVMGLGVAFGIAAPRAGATYLNVEDAEEIREQGGLLTPSAIACVLMGAFLLILALAEPIGTTIALSLAVVCLVGITISGWLTAKRQDELTKQIGLEASTMAFQVVLVAMGAWAVLALLRDTPAIDPLGLVSALALIQLFAVFIVITKRGMLMPR